MGAGDRVPVRRALGFAALPLVSLLTPFFVLPVLARHLSVAEWAAVAVGQSVGALGAIFVSFGWSVTGPAEVAQTPPRGRGTLWVESIRVRGVLFIVAAPLAAAAAGALVEPSACPVAAATALASLSSGLSLGWYAIGTGRPGLLAVGDAIPKAIGNLAGAGFVVLLNNVYWYPGVLLVLTTAPIVIFTLSERRQALDLDRAFLRLRVRKNLTPMLTELSAGAYSVGAAALVAANADSSRVVAQFSAGDRLVRFGATGIVVTGNSLQAWVSEARGVTFVRRARMSLALHAGVGAVGASVLSVAGPALTALLFGDPLRITRLTAIGLGFFFLSWSLETATGRHVLASRGHTRVLLSSTFIGSVIGVCAVVLGTRSMGVAGAAWGLALAVTTIALIQMFFVHRVLAAEKEAAED